MNRSLLPVLAILAGALPLAGCEIADNCDPDADPNCESPDAGGGDTGSCDPCGGLTEGQRGCSGDAAVATCVGGCLRVQGCGDGFCDSTSSCHDPYRYVMIVDGVTGGGSHPGADIDGVELVHEGRSYFASEVTDVQDNGGDNPADDINAVLGTPEGGTGSAHSCDLDAAVPHWYSLNGGFVVVSLDEDQAIGDGDTLYVHECLGTTGTQDTYDISVGVGDRADGVFMPIATDASGTFQKIISFAADGLD